MRRGADYTQAVSEVSSSACEDRSFSVTDAVARMERAESGSVHDSASPDSALLHPGYHGYENANIRARRVSPTMTDAELLDYLSGLEMRAMRAAGSDNAVIDALLADDFFEFGRSGVRWDKAGILGMTRSAATHAEATGFALTRLGAEHALLTYVSTLPGGGNRTLRSSVWSLRDGAWRMVFRQGTTVPV